MLKLGVAVPAPAGMDFDFNDARPMPFLSAPSTPRPFGACSLSAPTSPPRGAEFHRHFDDDDNFKGGEGRSEIPFSWQERPGTPKSQPPRWASNTYIEDDFAFDLSGELKKASLWADELFDRGKIKPLKPLQLDDDDDDDDSIDQQRSKLVSPIARGRKIINEVFSPRKKKDSDPLVENTRKRAENERGRERISGLTSRHRAARSLSPFRVAEFPWEEEEKEEEEEEEQEQTATQAAAAALNQNASISSNYSTPTSKSSSKKWRLRDFLLFRSASEGRASDKDPLRRCQANLFRKHEEVKKSTASFRSTDSESGSVRKGRMSAHELHYKTNKAASNDLKKKTFLPYKQGILGRFAFNPTIHALR